jgi:DNA-binding GntR family transcriptional regulator
VASKVSREQCNELQLLIEHRHRAASVNDMVTLVAHDMEFHRRICEWSGNMTLVRAWMPLYSQIQRFVTQTHARYFPHLEEVADMHQPIVDTLLRGSADEAASLIQQHIMLIWSRVESQQVPMKD